MLLLATTVSNHWTIAKPLTGQRPIDLGDWDPPSSLKLSNPALHHAGTQVRRARLLLFVSITCLNLWPCLLHVFGAPREKFEPIYATRPGPTFTCYKPTQSCPIWSNINLKIVWRLSWPRICPPFFSFSDSDEVILKKIKKNTKFMVIKLL